MMMIIVFVYILDVLFNKKAHKAIVVLCKGVNEMTYVITNTTLSLCRGGLQKEVGEDKHFGMALMRDESIFH
jgi:hypothetical protein